MTRARSALLGLGLAAVLPWACSEEPAPHDAVTLVVRGPDDAVVTAFVALVAVGDGAPVVHTCAPCEGGRLSLDSTPEARSVTLKAPGFERLTTPLAADARGDLAMALTPVPAPVSNADYATGFAADGDAAFTTLALTLDSELGRTQVVKFFVDDLAGVRGGPTVYFQATARHPLHFDFYRDVLGRAGTRRDFEQATYHGSDRPQAAGTLIRYLDLTLPGAATGTAVGPPVAMTFFPSDDLDATLALRLHQLIEARMPFLADAVGSSALVYLPAGDLQEQAAQTHATSFAQAGARWTRHADLYAGIREQRLNPGVAFGTLRRLTPDELARTVVSFRDVLLLSRLPNDLPIVGGTITEELQTPLAHVNVAARARGTPNLALLDASDDPALAPLVGELVRFEVTASGWSVRRATLAEAEAFWASRVPEPWTPPADVTSDGLPGFAELSFDDASRIGVKAANLAELHALLPDIAPDGFAVPFHYYDRFMATTTFDAARCAGARTDCRDEGRSADVCQAAYDLCAAGAPETLDAYVARLLADPTFRQDSVFREACLDGLRWLVRHVPVDPTFGAALDALVLGRFGPTTPVRLRSSTNAEDLPQFSGAGLYDSYGATGTSDPASEEIRKVWASVWNWRAFEERAFWGITQDAVRMGVAVHPAFPDERANGVIVTRNLSDPTVAGFYVNVQAGEVPVTNPADGSTPEVFVIVERPGGGVQVVRQRFSSLSPDAPLMTDAEVQALYTAAWRVQQHFAPLYEVDPDGFALDLEFKLHGPERKLVIKQARPYHDRSNGVSP